MKLRRVALRILGVAVVLLMVLQSLVIPERNRSLASRLRGLCGNASREGWSLSQTRLALDRLGCTLESTYHEKTATTGFQWYMCSIEYRDLDVFTVSGVSVDVEVSPDGKVVRAQVDEWLDGL